MLARLTRRVALCSALIVALPTLAHAQGGPAAAGAPSAEARAHFDRGLALLEAENFDAALAEFERSYALNARPSVLYNIGVTQQALRRYPEAARTLQRYLREGGTLAPARRAEVERAVAQLRSLIANVLVVVEPAHGTVRLDGRDVGPAPLTQPVEVGPGTHQLEVTRDGVSLAREEFTIASGEQRTIRLVPRQDTPSPGPGSAGGSTGSGSTGTTGNTVGSSESPTPSSIPAAPAASAAGGTARVPTHDRPARGLAPGLFLALGGTTVALGGAGLVTGILTLGARAEFERLYADDPSIRDVAQRGETLRLLTNVFLIASGASLVGTVIVLTQTRFGAPRPVASAGVYVLPDGFRAAVHGTF